MSSYRQGLWWQRPPPLLRSVNRDRSHRHRCIENNRGGNNRRPSYRASKRYHSKRPARDGYHPCNNQPRERKFWLAAKKMARARAPRAKCTATWVTRQNISGPNARRARPIKRSRQQRVRKHTTLTTSVTLRVTPQASASTARRWRATNSAKGTVVTRITPTTMTTLLLPSHPCLASKPSAMYYLLKGS